MSRSHSPGKAASDASTPIELRVKSKQSSPSDLKLVVQEQTFEFLMTSENSEIRISCYLDRDWPNVEASYAEVYVSDDCPFDSRVVRISPGSRTREVVLPGPMMQGEQITVVVSRTPR